MLRTCYVKKNRGGLTISDKIDRVLTDRYLALPIFAGIMFLVYYISVSTVGTWATDWANDGVFGEGWTFLGAFIPGMENLFGKMNLSPFFQKLLVDGFFIQGIPVIAENLLTSINCAPWLQSLVIDGIIGGVGSVLGFVPQILVLFTFLSFLEACGYMSRIAFVMDKIFRKFGLSGKSFIPLLVGTGCSVPGIMASRTIENERDRRMTIMTTSFIPCSAKLPVIAMIAGALFDGASWVAPSAYLVGIVAVVVSGLILKKTKLFQGDVSPFVMELPAYHMPTFSNILRTTWERGWSFIKKAGTVILLSSMVLWFLQNFGFEGGAFRMVEDLNNSVLANFGSVFAPIFTPLGFGNWQSTVAATTGLIAKENIVATFGVLLGSPEITESGEEIWAILRSEIFTPVSAYAFLAFNLLCAPCVAAMGAIRREMNSWKWTAFAIGYQCGFAYAVALMINQFGLLITGNADIVGLVAAMIVLVAMIVLIARPEKKLKK